MRYKPVPTPTDLEVLAAVQSAVPRVPGSTSDCCARILDRTIVEGRDTARAWLTFLQALELVRDTDTGYVRRDRDPTAAAVSSAFRERVYGVQEVLTMLDTVDGSVSAETIAANESLIPRWERNRDPTGGDWEDRITAILEWAVCFDLATATSDGYTRGSTTD